MQKLKKQLSSYKLTSEPNKLGSQNKSSLVHLRPTGAAFEHWPYPFERDYNKSSKQKCWSIWTEPVRCMKTTETMSNLIELLGCPNKAWASKAYGGLLDIIYHDGADEILQGLKTGGLNAFRKLFKSSYRIQSDWDGFAAGIDVYERLLRHSPRIRRACVMAWSSLLVPIIETYRRRESEVASSREPYELALGEVKKFQIKPSAGGKLKAKLTIRDRQKPMNMAMIRMGNQQDEQYKPMLPYEPQLEVWLQRIEGIVSTCDGVMAEEQAFLVMNIKRFLPDYESSKVELTQFEHWSLQNLREKISRSDECLRLETIGTEGVEPTVDHEYFEFSRSDLDAKLERFGPYHFRSGPAAEIPGVVVWTTSTRRITVTTDKEEVSEASLLAVKKRASTVVEKTIAASEVQALMHQFTPFTCFRNSSIQRRGSTPTEEFLASGGETTGTMGSFGSSSERGQRVKLPRVNSDDRALIEQCESSDSEFDADELVDESVRGPSLKDAEIQVDSQETQIRISIINQEDDDRNRFDRAEKLEPHVVEDTYFKAQSGMAESGQPDRRQWGGSGPEAERAQTGVIPDMTHEQPGVLVSNNEQVMQASPRVTDQSGMQQDQTATESDRANQVVVQRPEERRSRIQIVDNLRGNVRRPLDEGVTLKDMEDGSAADVTGNQFRIKLRINLEAKSVWNEDSQLSYPVLLDTLVTSKPYPDGEHQTSPDESNVKIQITSQN